LVRQTVQSDPKESTIRPFDIGSAEQNQLQGALASLTQIAVLFCKELRRTIPFLTRQRARVVLGAAGPASALSASAEGPSFLVQLEAPGQLWAALHFDSSAIVALVDGLFGPPSSEPADAEQATPESEDEEAKERPALGDALTLAQRALLGRLCGDLSTELRKSAEVLCKAQLTTTALLSLKRDELPDLERDAIAIDCCVEDVTYPWAIRLFMGGAALKRIAAEEAATAIVSDGPTMAEAALRIPVSVVAELGRVTLKLSQVLGLRTGDTLRLPSAANDPVLVRVEGIAKFDAVPVISRGQVAVKIQSRHTE
jgi:flagellar motor switch/type III secretory pathway protein FliN